MHDKDMTPWWAKKKGFLQKIGRLKTKNGFSEHIFYREKRKLANN